MCIPWREYGAIIFYSGLYAYLLLRFRELMV